MVPRIKVTSRVKVLFAVLVVSFSGLQEIESLQIKLKRSVSQTDFVPKCDDIDPFKRIKCGNQPTRGGCEALGCCFNNHVMGAETCFHLKGSCSAVQPWSRLQCGSPEMTRENCEAEGCCYDDTLINTPFCYRKIR